MNEYTSYGRRSFCGGPEPAHKFIRALLPTLELNKLCREYDDSIVYALLGTLFFLYRWEKVHGIQILEKIRFGLWRTSCIF